MATTTNFGWETPDDTDLVKDGALAMRTLGNAIDASLVDLKGGTTGQVLSKTSNTDMDFTWVTSDDANAIQNAIVDAKGDLITATAADTPARLAVGSNGDTLVADSAATTGLRWSGANQLNPIINSAYDIWQRGTSAAGSITNFAADRWNAYRSVAGSTYSRQVTGDTTNLPNIQYCTRVQRDSGNTSTNELFYFQDIETSNSIPYAGKTVTISFYARKGANYSAASSAMVANVITGTGTDQSLRNGYTNSTFAIQQTATLTTTWQRFSYSGSIASTATQLGVRFDFTPVGTAGAADFYEITGVQIDIGSTALPYRRSGGTIQGETAACERYFKRFGGNAAFESFGVGQAYGTGSVLVILPFKVTMRGTPVGTYAAASNFRVLTSTYSGVVPTSIASNTLTRDTASLLITGASSLTAGNASGFEANNSLSAILDFSAEL
jgi:hypothetical protein